MKNNSIATTAFDIAKEIISLHELVNRQEDEIEHLKEIIKIKDGMIPEHLRKF